MVRTRDKPSSYRVMSVKYKHADVYSMYFCTFTCYKWMHLFSLTNGYDLVYNWFNVLKEDNVEAVGYVVMPNHVHCILYFRDAGFSLNKILANGKRFMAYGLVDKLEKANDTNTLAILKDGLTEREIKKKQLYKVFKDSFDGKPIFSGKFLLQKLNYIHYNPVSGKWKLASDFVSYEHSSASFYEDGLLSILFQSIIKSYRLALQSLSQRGFHFQSRIS